MNSKDQANTILCDLLERNTDVKSALIASADGITVTSVNLDQRSNRLSAMAAAALGLGRQMISTISRGDLNEINISGSNGHVFVYAISDAAVMILVTKELPNVAMVNWEARKAITQIMTLD